MRHLLAAFVLTAAVAAQTPQSTDIAAPAFEVASVKPNRTGTPGGSFVMPPGRFTATNIPLRVLITNAYQLSFFQVVGGPEWLDSERFDIVATAPEGSRPDQTMLMLRALMAERFKLVVHKESRDTQLYALVKARNDDRLGPGLTRSTIDCAPIRAERAAAARARGTGPASFQPPPPNEKPVCTTRMMGRPGATGGMTLLFSSGNTTIADLATTLRSYVGREVIDKTGLAGEYDVELQFSPSGTLATAAPPTGAVPAAPLDDGITVFTAVQEQLGLKLESTRGPVEFLVIDSAERPTAD